MEKFVNFMHSDRARHGGIVALGLFIVLWVIYRFIAIAMMNASDVFNVSRVHGENGVPVAAIVVHRTDAPVCHPLAVRNNRATVPFARVNDFHSGDKIGDGAIVSVSQKIDLDSGMYVIRTRNVPDGTHLACADRNGFFVPVYAVHDGVVFVAENGVAVARNVRVAVADATNAVITDGLSDGDIVILSGINDGVTVSTVMGE